MNRNVLKEIIRRSLKKAVNERSAIEMHRMMSGDMVPFGCEACMEDIENRIDDARYDRDACPGRTDSREHYNGILKVLRRKLRRAHKVNGGE